MFISIASYCVYQLIKQRQRPELYLQMSQTLRTHTHTNIKPSQAKALTDILSPHTSVVAIVQQQEQQIQSLCYRLKSPSDTVLIPNFLKFFFWERECRQQSWEKSKMLSLWTLFPWWNILQQGKAHWDWCYILQLEYCLWKYLWLQVGNSIANKADILHCSKCAAPVSFFASLFVMFILLLFF